MQPLGLYIHIPFCKRKCAYCDFVSSPGCEEDMDKYIDNLIGEARLYADALFSRRVDTVFVGGGTPSLLTPQQFARLTKGIKECCNWGVAEFTMEANPETLDENKLAAYADCGVNRLSMGLQTHDDDILARIGRRHTWDAFLQAYEAATKHFDNINADTIFGLPGQTLDSYLETLRRVIALGAKHVSSYALKLEAGTPLAAQFVGVDEDMDREMYHAGIKALEAAGLMQYETSNFAITGCECRHNMKYWTEAEYLGLGVAAHSMLRQGRRIRFGNVCELGEYGKHIRTGRTPISERQELEEVDEKAEFVMLRLRLKDGIAYADYDERFGEAFEDRFGSAVRFCEKAGLLTQTKSGIAPTVKGFDLQNSLISQFIKCL